MEHVHKLALAAVVAQICPSATRYWHIARANVTSSGTLVSQVYLPNILIESRLSLEVTCMNSVLIT
jgi:hypothetical protein